MIVNQAEKTAQEQFDEFEGFTEKDLIEQLRFFCSLCMMKDQDWLDIEKYFDAVINERKKLKRKNKELRKEIKRLKDV